VRVRTYWFSGFFTRPPGTSTRNHPCESTTSKAADPALSTATEEPSRVTFDGPTGGDFAWSKDQWREAAVRQITAERL
jgi:hypothetical protein